VALDESLAELTRTLEGLRQRLHQLGQGQAASAEGGGDEAATGFGPEGSAAGIGALQDILALSGTGERTSQVFTLALDRIGRMLDADRAMVFLFDRSRGLLVARAARGFRREDPAEIALASGEGLVGRALAERRLLGYSRAGEAPPEDAFLARFPVREAVAVPIQVAGEPAGVLYVGRRVVGVPFSLEQTLVVLLIADQLGAALAHERLLERIDEHVGRLGQLGAFSGQAVVGRDLSRILAGACDAARRLTRVSMAAVWTRVGGALVLGASSGLPGAGALEWQVDPDRGLAAEAFSGQRPGRCPDLEAAGAADEPFLRSIGLKSCAVVPLRSGNEVVGALYLADPEARDFSADELEAVQVLTSVAGLAIENDRLFREVESALDELRAAQERLVQTEKARALGEMAGGVAHEFNNILAIILGKAQLLLARSPDNPFREGLAVIEEAAWRAADIVRRLQGFGTGGTDDIRSHVDVGALVRDAVTFTRAIWKDEAEARGVRIEVATDVAATAPVPGSAAALREAVTNLLLNAFDAMPAGGRLSLTTREEDDGVTIVVEDTGEGMAEEVRRRIFDPFFTTRHPRRSGLGLSVVHGIVARHGGRIAVVSESGRGTRVSVWLPAAPHAALPAPPPADDAERAAASILVLEDEEPIRKALVETLAREGHAVDSAPDGLTGLARFQRGGFDVVLTDLSLPECSGLDVARSVKRMRPGTPVVLITGWGHLVDPARLRDSGVDLMLVKPFRMERLLAVLQDALRLRPA
jgi:signal transduction histidine kinase